MIDSAANHIINHLEGGTHDAGADPEIFLVSGSLHKPHPLSKWEELERGCGLHDQVCG